MLSGARSQMVDMATKYLKLLRPRLMIWQKLSIRMQKMRRRRPEPKFMEKNNSGCFALGDIQSKCCEAVGKIRQETKAFPAVWWINHEYAKCFSFLFYTFFIGFKHGCEDNLMVANFCTKSFCRGLLWWKPEFNEEWGQWVGKHEQWVGECGSVADIQRWYR